MGGFQHAGTGQKQKSYRNLSLLAFLVLKGQGVNFF